MTLVKRAGNVTVKRFASRMTYRFSADDKWLAVWGNQGLQILELATGRTTLTLNQAGVKKVRFVGGNSILSVQLARETMLVPLDFDLMKRFATWLTPRDLSSREKCLYGLAAQDCR